MSLLKTNEIQNYNGSSLTLTASTVSTSAQLNTGGNISVTGSLNVSDDSTTRTNLGLGTIATQDSDSITVTGGTATLGALTVSGSDSGDLVRFTQTGSGNALVVEDSANPDSTPFVVDSSGIVISGHTSSVSAYGFGSQFQILSTSNAYQLNAAFRSDASAPILTIAHSRNGIVGSHTVVQSGDDLGAVAFAGSDGTAFIRGAQISAQVDGTPGTNDMPGRLIFSTTADGASFPTERMRIKSNGDIQFGSSGDIGKINASGSDIFQFYQNRDGATPFFYFNTSGNFGVFSDVRLKENITSLSKEDATNLIKNINPVEFNWKSDSGDNTKRISGVLAQDVLAHATTEGQKNILTHWETFDESDPDCPYMGLSDHRLIPSIIGTIQHLLDELDEKTSQIDTLTAKTQEQDLTIASLISRIEALETT